MKRGKGYSVIFTSILALILLSACASTEGLVSTEIPKGITPPVTGEISPDAKASADAAVQELARQLGIDAQSINVVSIDPTQWSNSCLGAPGADEMCAEVITPGFIGILEANGVQYEFHSDQAGDQIRFVPGAIQAVQQALASHLEISSENIRLVSYEQMMWRDSCLGIESPNQSCLAVITPGYRIVLQAGNEQYIYHTDEIGSNLVQAEATQVDGKDIYIVWSQSDADGCQRAMIGMQEISFGACDGKMTEVPFHNETNIIDLRYYLEKYAPFEAQVGSGKISFSGKGSEAASPTVQRMIIEWSRLVTQIAEAGQVDPALGRVFVWHREGGIGGFCDNLSVYVTGKAQATSCEPGESVNPERIYLREDQLEQLYAWVDSLKPFEVEQKDPGTVDALTLILQFEGMGELEASAEVQQAILDFAALVYAEATIGQSNE